MHEPGFQRPSLSEFVLTFAKAMVGGDFRAASSMLSDEMRDEYPPSQLKAKFESMYDYAGDTAIEKLEVIDSIEDWPGKESMIIGRASVGLEGPHGDPGGAWQAVGQATGREVASVDETTVGQGEVWAEVADGDGQQHDQAATRLGAEGAGLLEPVP